MKTKALAVCATVALGAITSACQAEPTKLTLSGHIEIEDAYTSKQLNSGFETKTCDFKAAMECSIRAVSGTAHLHYDADTSLYHLSIRHMDKTAPYPTPFTLDELKEGIAVTQPEWTQACNCFAFRANKNYTVHLKAEEAK